MNVSGLPILPGINIWDIKTSDIQYSYLWLTLADTNRLHALFLESMTKASAQTFHQKARQQLLEVKLLH